MTETKLFIHGRYVDAHSGKSFDNINPATGETFTRSHAPAWECIVRHF